MKITVAGKMIVLVVTAVLGLVGLSWQGQNRMQEVYEKTNFANVNSIPAIDILGTAIESLGRMRVRIYRHVLHDDAAEKAKINATIEQSRDVVSDSLKKYEDMIMDDRSKQLLSEDVDAFNDYLKGVDITLAFSSQNKREEARDTLTQYSQQAERLNKALNNHMDYNIALAKKSADTASAAKSDAAMFSSIISGIVVILTALLGFFITRDLLRQLGGEPDFAAEIANKIAIGDLSTAIELKPGDTTSIMAAMKNMAFAIQALVNDADMLAKAAMDGRLQTRADADKHHGDFRKVVSGVNNTLDSVIVPLNEAAEVLMLIEQGDLTRTVNGNYQGQLGEFKDTVNNTIAKLSQTIAEVISAADQLGNASEQISATSQSLSQSASEQAAGVEETSASIEQMTVSINQNADNAKITDGMAGKTSQEAIEGGTAVKQTVAAMKDIAGKIGIIDDIAYQTNMLALNAAIEAARAGDHGKGFAVVAAEVRKLAERSQVAAREIGELAETSVKTAESAGQLLDAIVPSIAKTSDLVQEIAAASQEQSTGVNQINIAMNQMNEITQQNASASEELAATAEEMTGQAEQLQSLMSFFKITGGKTFAHSTPKTPTKPETAKPAAVQLKSKKPANAEYDLSKFERF